MTGQEKSQSSLQNICDKAAVAVGGLDAGWSSCHDFTSGSRPNKVVLLSFAVTFKVLE
jgi:hypothetical protein